MKLEDLQKREKSLAEDIQKTKSGLSMMAEQEKAMTAQLHMLTGHFNEVKYQISQLQAAAVAEMPAPAQEEACHGEANCESAEQVA